MNTHSQSIKAKILAGALLLSQTLVLSPLAAFAQDGDVMVAGTPIFSLPSASGGAKRAEAVQQNLDNALVAAKDKTPAAVNITYVKGLPVITMGGYQVITIDGATAKAANSTPALLAKKYADALRNSLRDQASISSYVAQLSGDYASSAPATTSNPNSGPSPSPNYQPPQQQAYQGDSYAAQPPYQGQQYPQGQGGNVYQAQTPGYQAPYQPSGPVRQGRVAYAPAGLVIPITLSTGIATQVAKSGDVIQATISQAVMLGDSMIPMGSVITGNITDSEAGKMLGRSGALGIKFNSLRTPDGQQVPISAHLIGGIGKYTSAGDDTIHGETWKGKVASAGIRGAVGAGTGAALGTAVGAIAGGGRGAGRGAWSGTAIGAGVGVVDSLILRKGKDVQIPAGTNMQLQLDAPVSLAGGSPAQPYNY